MFTPKLGDTTPVVTTRASSTRPAVADSGFRDTMSSVELRSGGQNSRNEEDPSDGGPGLDVESTENTESKDPRSRLDLRSLAGRAARPADPTPPAEGMQGDTKVVIDSPDTAVATASKTDLTAGFAAPLEGMNPGELPAVRTDATAPVAGLPDGDAVNPVQSKPDRPTAGDAALVRQAQVALPLSKGETKVAVGEDKLGGTRQGGSTVTPTSLSRQRQKDEANVDAPVSGAQQDTSVPTAKDAGSVLSLLTNPVTPVVAKAQQQEGRNRVATPVSTPVDPVRDTMVQADLPELPIAIAPSGAADLPSEDKTFRFSSAREGRPTMDMLVGVDKDGKASFETSRSSAGPAENIVVLDSRRFLGFAQSQNGSALTTAMTQDPEWSHAMQPGSTLSNAATQTSTGRVVNTLKLQMTPIELGNVTATLRLVGEELSVHLTVENRAAHQQLSEDSSGILDALRSQGFQVDQVSVSIVAASQSDPSQQQGSDAGQRSPGFERQEGGAGQGQGQPSSQSSSRHASGTTENETALDSRPDANAGGRAGDLYL